MNDGNDPEQTLPPQGSGRSNFVLRDDIAEAYRRYANMVRTSAPSERLHAFSLAARRIAALIHPTDFPFPEAVDRLWATAEAYGLLSAHGVDAVQNRLSDALNDPMTLTEDDPVRLDIEADEQEQRDRRLSQRRGKDRRRKKASDDNS